MRAPATNSSQECVVTSAWATHLCTASTRFAAVRAPVVCPYPCRRHHPITHPSVRPSHSQLARTGRARHWCMHVLCRGRALLRSQRRVQNGLDPADPTHSADAGQQGRGVHAWRLMCDDGTMARHQECETTLPPLGGLHTSVPRGLEQLVHLPQSQLVTQPAVSTSRKGQHTCHRKPTTSLAPPYPPHSAPSSTVPAPQLLWVCQ